MPGQDRPAIAPTWEDVGKLGAIAAIRTALGFFLGREIAATQQTEGSAHASPAPPPP